MEKWQIWIKAIFKNFLWIALRPDSSPKFDSNLVTHFVTGYKQIRHANIKAQCKRTSVQASSQVGRHKWVDVMSQMLRQSPRYWLCSETTWCVSTTRPSCDPSRPPTSPLQDVRQALQTYRNQGQLHRRRSNQWRIAHICRSDQQPSRVGQTAVHNCPHSTDIPQYLTTKCQNHSTDNMQDQYAPTDLLHFPHMSNLEV